MNWRRIIFGIIIIICIVAVNYGVYWTVNEEEEKKLDIPVAIIDLEKVASEFKNIFDNTIDYQNYEVSNVTKADSAKELVYTKTQNNQKVDGKYEFNVSIPTINIARSSMDTINEEIENIFYSRVNSIMSGKTSINNDSGEVVEESKKISTTVYEVKYKAYINSNILSLVIKANLKEGMNQQRTFVKTYNFNLTTYEQININQLREIKGLNSQFINKQIQEVVNSANAEAESLSALGYEVYIRDNTLDIYNIDKITTLDCFLGKNQIMYIVYPYGNRENTTEMDIIVFE